MKKDKLTQAQAYAQSRGGVCLDDAYINNKTKMQWKCSVAEHPVWHSNFDNVVNKQTWCCFCSGKAKKTNALEVAREYAKSRGGFCLSTEYINVDEKLEWKCGNDKHASWMASYDTVLRKKTWCKCCANIEQKKDKDGLTKAQAYAKSRGGVCLSLEYINQNSNLEWKCSNEHHASWFANSKIIARNSWCKACYHEK